MSHGLDWAIPLFNAEERSGSLVFSITVSKVNTFFPVNVSFVGLASIVGIRVASASQVDGGENVVFSEEEASSPTIIL